jgi:hypothetical protein
MTPVLEQENFLWVFRQEKQFVMMATFFGWGRWCLRTMASGNIRGLGRSDGTRRWPLDPAT